MRALDPAIQAAWFDRLTTAREDDPLLAVIAERLASWQDPEGTARRQSVLSALEDGQSALSMLDQDYYVRRAIERDRYLPLSQALIRRLEGLRQNLESIRAPQIDLKSFLDPTLLQERWSAADVNEKRRLRGLAIREVRVRQGIRGQRFDPSSRLVVVWAADRSMDP